MPIRVNLKEIFPADSQEITVDKINFNFNKLLELGIGEQGLIGLSGPIGSIGPIGAQGEDGVRGSQWYVDAATDPNTLTFQDLLVGDLYLDSTNISIWQWTGTSWVFIADITAVINNYLAASPSPFTRGLGIGPASNKDERFILFNRRSDSALDVLPGGAGANAANNDVLFLNNFNEDDLNTALQSQTPPGFIYGPALLPIAPQVSTESLFNSLISVNVDHTASSLGRYHLDMGVLYDSNPLANLDPKLTTVFENFKMRYVREGSSVHAGQDHYNVSLFTLDIPEISPAFNRVTNGIFKFESPKFLPTIENSKTTFYVGSKYGLDEIIGTSGTVQTDGILFVDEIPTIYGNLGLAKNYSIPNLPDTGYIQNVSSPASYFMLDSASSVEATLVNTSLYQNNGNIIQAGSGEPRLKYQTTTSFVSPGTSEFIGHMGIATDGENLYTVSGCHDIDDPSDLVNKFGYFNKYSIENPNRPTGLLSLKRNGATSTSSIPIINCSTNDTYSNNNAPIGPGISDIAIAGKYGYAVSTQNISTTNSTTVGLTSYRRTYFQVLELDSMNESGPRRVARLGENAKGGSPSVLNDPEELTAAYRIKVKDRFAIVATNALFNQATANSLGNTFPISPGTEYQGRITAIDITEQDNPVIVASAYQDKAYQFGVTPGTGGAKSAFMDFEIVGDKVFALTWEQAIPVATPIPPSAGSCNVMIRLNVFDLSELNYETAPPNPSIEWHGQSQTSFFSSLVTFAQYGSIFKRGAVTAKDNKVYAAWSNEIRVYSTDSPSINSVGADCLRNYQQLELYTLPFAQGATNGVVDMKRIGNTLWVLALVDGTSKLYKLDVSNGLSTTPGSELQLVSEKSISSPAARFQVVGKHLYLACHNTSASDANGISLIAIDFDGIYTDGAHIGSLRAEKLDVVGKSHIGEDLTVQGSLNAGGGIHSDAHITGTYLDVYGSARFRSVANVTPGVALYRTTDGTLTLLASDERLKTNIENLSGALEKVCNLRGVSFDWEKNPELGKRIGLIAQEVEEVVPELVFTNENSEEKYKGVHYSETVALLIEAIKEQNTIIEDLKARVASLEQGL